jgi:hypothetical protein
MTPISQLQSAPLSARTRITELVTAAPPFLFVIFCDAPGTTPYFERVCHQIFAKPRYQKQQQHGLLVALVHWASHCCVKSNICG